MKARITSNTKDYEIKDIISINFTGGTLTIIWKDWDTDEVKVSQYTAESLCKSGQVNIQ